MMACLLKKLSTVVVGGSMMMLPSLLLLFHPRVVVVEGFVIPMPVSSSSRAVSSTPSFTSRLSAASRNNNHNPNRTTKVIPELDPTDPQYQVSPDYPPNKESTWSFPIEQDGWILAHDTLRFEMKNLRETLEVVVGRERQLDDDSSSRVLDDWMIQYLTDVWKIHRELVHIHHTDEDDIMVPAFRERFIWPTKLESDHHEVEDALVKLDQMFSQDYLKPGPFDFITNFFEGRQPLSPSERLANVLEEFDKYSEDILKPHLLEEERTMLPLQRAYMTPDDMLEVNQKIMEGAPPTILGSVIHCTRGRAGFQQVMKQDGMSSAADFELAWETIFEPGYQNYCTIFVDKLNALQQGKEIAKMMEEETASEPSKTTKA